MDYVLERLKEPSTYAGVAALAGIFGVRISPTAWHFGLEVLSVVAAGVAMVVPDRKQS